MMTSAYPGALDALKTNVNGATDTLASVPHDALHNDANAAIKAVQATLGTNPQGTAATVAERLAGAVQTVQGLAPDAGGNVDLASKFASPFVINAADYGARGDRIDLTDAAMTSGSAVLSSAHVFTPSDAGKVAQVAGAGASGAALIATITSVVGGVATLSAAAGTTVSGAACSFGTNNNTTLQAANGAAAALVTAGTGATVLIPAGRYLLSTAVVPGDRVHWLGMGAQQTVLYPMGTVHAFYRLGTVGGEVMAPAFTDLAVDGELQTGLQKGWYLNHVKDGTWTRCICRNTGASGFGCDYLPGCRFIDCTADNCGRLGTTASPGCSGFGIGTGEYAVEDVVLSNCTATGNKRFGVFFENQATAIQSKDAQIVGGRFEGNQWGVSDNGVDGLLVSGAHIVGNIEDGFKLTTTAAIHQTGTKGLITGCVITGNGTGGSGDGVQFDFIQSGSATYGRYTVVGNRIEDNANGSGIRVRVNSTDVVSGLEFRDNDVQRNGWSGIYLAGSTGAALVTDSTITGNTCRDNGPKGTSGKTDGIQIDVSMTACKVRGNDCSDTRPSGSRSQSFGINVASGTTLTGGCITDNDLRNNGTSPLQLGGTIASPCIVDRNRGYNPIGTDSLVVGASPYAYTSGPQPETLYVLGGTFSQIQINGVTIYNAGANSGTLVIPVEPYAAVSFTYSSVPIAIKRYRH